MCLCAGEDDEDDDDEGATGKRAAEDDDDDVSGCRGYHMCEFGAARTQVYVTGTIANPLEYLAKCIVCSKKLKVNSEMCCGDVNLSLILIKRHL